MWVSSKTLLLYVNISKYLHLFYHVYYNLLCVNVCSCYISGSVLCVHVWCHFPTRMRLPGPRTFIRYVVLVSLPSLVMLVYILSQMLPLAIKVRQNVHEFYDLPIMRTVPHDSQELNGWAESEEKEAELSDAKAELAQTITTTEVGPVGEPLPSGIWKFLDASPEGDEMDLGGIGDDIVSSKPIYVDPYWSLKSNNLSVSNSDDDYSDSLYNIANTPERPIQYPDLSLNLVPEDPNKPSLQQLEEYILANYKSNMEKGFSRFSLSVTEDIIEKGPLVSIMIYLEEDSTHVQVQLRH